MLRETETKMAEPPRGVTPGRETLVPDTFADESSACSDWMYARWVCKRTSDSRMTGRLRSASALVAGGCVGGVLQDLAMLCVELFEEFLALMMPVDGFDGLFEIDGDEQADADGGDVDEEVAPGVGGGVGRVDVEHGAPWIRGGDQG